MRRVLLLLENFNEQADLQSVFQRLGFTVECISQSNKLPQALMEFNAQVLIAQGAGRKINSELVAIQLAKSKVKPIVLLVFPQHYTPKPADFRVPQFGGVLVSPFVMETVLKSLAKAGGLEVEPLLEKYEKIMSTQIKVDDQLNIVKSKQAGSENGPLNGRKFSSGKIADPERAKKYAALVQKIPQSQTDGIPGEIMAQNVKQLRQAEAQEDSTELEEERGAFVKAMFKK